MADDDYDFTDFEKMPIRFLGPGSRSNLSLFLNPEQLLATDSGHARDFRGIAELIGFSYTQIQNFKRASDPLSALLDSYSSLPNGKDATVKDLLFMLEQIGRFDVIDDMIPCLKSDLSAMHQRKNRSPESATSGTSYDESQILSLNDIITGEKTMFHAYVCYADADLDFVREMSSHLQKEGINLFIRERDLPAGALQYDVFTQLIEKRCGRVLVILSPDFLLCSECDLQTRFATSLGVNQRMRKLIPVVYKACESLPAALNMLTKIDFSRGDKNWSWRKLIVSIKTPDTDHCKFIPQTLSSKLTSPLSLTAAFTDCNATLIDLSDNLSASAPPLTPSVQVHANPVINVSAHSSKQQSTGSWIKSMKDRLMPSKCSANSKSQTESRSHLIEKTGDTN